MSNVTQKETKVAKLKEITDENLIHDLLEKISKEEMVTVSIVPTEKAKQLIWENHPIFLFEVDHRCGNERYNAISVIRDLLNIRYGDWTRKKVEPLVSFENTAKAV